MEFDFNANRIILTREQCKIMLLNKVGIVKTTPGHYSWGGTEKFRYNNIYKDLKLSVEFHTKNLKSRKRTQSTERVYWVLEDIKDYSDSKYPICYCGNFVNFISLQRGFSKGCRKSHNTWKGVMDKRELSRNSGKIFTKIELKNMIADNKNGKMQIPMLQKSADFVRSLDLHLKDFPRRYKGNRQFQELCFAVVNDLEEPPKCKMCGNFRTFMRYDRPYATLFCGNSCRNNDKTITQKLLSEMFKKNLELYGSKEHPNSAKARILNAEKQKLDNFETIKRKQRETCMRLYGVENKSMLPEVQEKFRATYRKRTGYDHPMQNPQHKKRMHDYFIEKYGIIAVGGPSLPKKHDCGLMYQGSHELNFLNLRVKFHKHLQTTRGLILPYKDSNDKDHMYFVDFKIECENLKSRLVEIKGSSRFFMYELHSGILELKCKALYNHYKEHSDLYDPPLFVFNKNKYYWFDNISKIETLIAEFKEKYLKSEYFTKGKSIFGLK